VLWFGWLQKEYTTVSVTVGGEEAAAGASPANACLATVNAAGKTPSIAIAATTPTQILLDNRLIRKQMASCPTVVSEQTAH
jgi:hypothetical protein